MMIKDQTKNLENDDAATPPPGHDKMLAGLSHLLSVPKVELDRREREWRAQHHKRGRPKKAKAAEQSLDVK